MYDVPYDAQGVHWSDDSEDFSLHSTHNIPPCVS